MLTSLINLATLVLTAPPWRVGCLVVVLALLLLLR